MGKCIVCNKEYHTCMSCGLLDWEWFLCSEKCRNNYLKNITENFREVWKIINKKENAPVRLLFELLKEGEFDSCMYEELEEQMLFEGCSKKEKLNKLMSKIDSAIERNNHCEVYINDDNINIYNNKSGRSLSINVGEKITITKFPFPLKIEKEEITDCPLLDFQKLLFWVSFKKKKSKRMETYND